MLDPGRAWLDELLNRHVGPYCRTRGIAITVLVRDEFAREQFHRAVAPQAQTKIDVRVVAANQRGKPSRSGLKLPPG